MALLWDENINDCLPLPGPLQKLLRPIHHHFCILDTIPDITDKCWHYSSSSSSFHLIQAIRPISINKRHTHTERQS